MQAPTISFDEIEFDGVVGNSTIPFLYNFIFSNSNKSKVLPFKIGASRGVSNSWKNLSTESLPVSFLSSIGELSNKEMLSLIFRKEI
jgi:hypothetical protein